MAEKRIVSIRADRLVVAPHLQARSALDRQHVERLRNADPKTWGPLLATPIPDRPGYFAVCDGAHRLEAGKQLPGGATVTAYPCIVQDGIGYAESFAANTSHPLTLGTQDRKAFARALHDADPGLSARELARRVGLSPTTVIAALAKSNGAEPRTAHISSALAAIVRAAEGGEGEGSPEELTRHVLDMILASKRPKAVANALTVWQVPLTVALQRAVKRLSKAR